PEPRRVDPVTVPIADEGDVPGVAEDERVIGSPQATTILSQFVDDVEARFRRAVERHRVATVTVEVPDQRDVTRVAEVEGHIGDSLSVGVPQIHEAVGLAVEPGSVGPVAVPVTHEGDVARIAVVEATDLVHAVPQVPEARLGPERKSTRLNSSH